MTHTKEYSEPNLYGMTNPTRSLSNSMAKTNQKETNSNVQQAFDNIAEDVFERLIPEQEQQRIFSQTLQPLANGCPVRLTR
jgi:hypothetical protein